MPVRTDAALEMRRSVARVSACALVAVILSLSARANAQGASPPGPREDDAFDIMNVLAHHGLHDIHDESWNAYGQFTYMTSYKPRFHAAYTNARGSTSSLWPEAERGFTLTSSLFVGVRLWRGAEVYVSPEVIAERAFSQLKGIGGATENFELQKTGSDTPLVYRSRLFLRQTIGLGGSPVEKTSDPLQLGKMTDRRRLVLTAGNFTALDVFDRNTVTGDPRQTFFNEAFMTHPAYDFPAESRGYSWGGAAELYWDDWALRIGRLAPPQNPNGQPVDLRLWRYYGDSFELEHDHALLGQPGAVRLLAYRNYEVMGRFNEAIAAYRSDSTRNAAACQSYNYGSGNFTAPDLCWVRRPNVKVGIGVNAEQHISRDVGVFARGMIHDGRTEVDSYDSSDGAASLGVVAKGPLWGRRFDVAGLAFAASWISPVHAEYLAMGGVDGFIGDGRLKAAVENLVDVFYSVNFLEAVWLTADYQHLRNPGYNADRGPVNIIGGRVHAEF